MRLILLVMALCLANFTLLRAQSTELTYSFSSPEACAGVTELVVDVTVDGLTELEAGSFTIVWDPAIIGFDYTDATEGPIDFNLANLSRSQFGFGPSGAFVADGKMTFGWSSGNPSGTGASVSNGDRIFSIKFDIVAAGMTSAITGDASITPIITYYATNNGTIGTTVINAGAVNTSDLTPPTITCPANVSMTAAAGQTSATVTGIEGMATDGCALSSLSYQLTGATTGGSPLTGINDASNLSFNVGTTTVTYTATDAANNPNTCSFDVEILANTSAQPMVTFDVQDINLSCTDTNTEVDVNVDGFTDVLGFQGTFKFDQTQFAYNPANPVSNFNIGVPNFSIADFNFSSVATGQITFTYTNTTTFDLNTGELLFSVPLDIIGTPATAVTIDDSRTNLLVVTLTNGVAGFATISVDPGAINLADMEGPVVSGCSSNLTLSTDATTCTASPTFAVPTAIDVCTGAATAVLETTLGAGDAFPVGTTTVRYRFDDGNGNSSFCAFDVIVSDMQAPTFANCPAAISAPVASGACSGPATWTAPTAMDACDPAVQLTSNFAPGDIFPLGPTTVIYTATDASGNTETCEFEVTITDNVDPTFDLCPADQLFGLSAGECGFSGSIIIPTASDPCGQVTVAPSSPLPSPFPVGTTTVTYVATDLSGNTANCSFDVIVTDSDAPTVDSCPGDVTLTAPANACSAVANWTAPAFSDPCGGITVTTNFDVGDAVPLGTNLVVYTATDASGNPVTCEFTVTVIEVDAPVLSGCPATISVSATSGTCGAVVNYTAPTALDACDATPTIDRTAGLASGEIFPVGTTVVTYVATDDSGNTSMPCTFEVVVTDDELPLVDCPADQTLQAQLGSSAATAPGISVMTSDNCGISDTTFVIRGATTFTASGDASDLAFNVGVSTVTYSVTDVNGNVDSCSFTVTVNSSSLPPVIVCPNDTSAIAIPSTCTNSFAGLELVVTSDLADLSSVTYELTGATLLTSPTTGINSVSGVDFANGLTTVTYTATNLVGQQTMCSFTVEITPGAGEPVQCPNDITMNAALDSCGVSVFWTAPTPLDACGNPLMLTGTHASGDFFALGTTMVTYTATDGQGAQTICSFDITVLDIEAIVVAGCPMDVTVTADMNACAGMNVQWVEPTFTSACNTPTVVSSHVVGQAFPLGSTTVTYTASLANGQTAACSFMVVVEDLSAPNIDVCTADVTVAAPAGVCEVAVTWTEPVAFDNCSPVTYSYSATNGSMFPVGDSTVTAYATDASGNVDSCSFSVSVTGGTTPVFDCPSSVVFRADGRFISDPDGFVTSAFSAGCDGIFIDFDLPTATTQCGTVTVRQIGGAVSGSIFPVGFSFVLFEATAADGSTSQCQLSIGVEAVPTLLITSPDTSVCNGSTVLLEPTGIRRANYMWSGPNGFASTDSIVTLSNITVAQAGTYIVRSRSEGGCVQADSITVIVDADPMLEILTPEFVCGVGSNDLVLQVADTSGLTLVNWLWTGPNGFVSTLETPIIPNATPSMTGIYTVDIRTSNGCTATISKMVNVGTQPSTPLVVVSDLTPCVDQEIIFTGSAYTGTSVNYDWTVSPATGATLNPVNFVSVFRATEAGSYDVCYTATVGGCASQVVCTTIIVEAVPTFNISGSDNIECTDGTEDIRLEEMSGTASTYEWRGPNGSILSNNGLLLIENVTSINAGLYSLQVSSPNGCSADTAINVRISERPDAPVLQSDLAMLCIGSSATLSATDLGAGVSYNWSANTSDAQAGIPSASNGPVLTVTPTMAGNYTYQLNVERNGCTSETVTVDLEVLEMPNAVAVLSGSVDCILDGATIQLMETLGEGNVTGWTGPLGFTSTEASPVLSDLSDNNSGVYTVTVENAAGCVATSSVTVSVTRGLEQLETFFDGALCRGETVQLFASEVQGATYEWTGPNGYTSAEQNPVIQSLSPGLSGSYTVTATMPNGCSSPASEPIELTVLSAPEAVDDFFDFTLESDGGTINILGNDILSANGTTVTITREALYGTATVNQDGFIVYTSNATAPREDRVEYEVCYVDCPSLCSRAIINIELDYDTETCITTTVITPNGDGQNDEFYVSCLEDPTQLPQNSLTIYNEYGDEVYSAAPYLNNWEGTYNGKRLPDGTYYFLFRESSNGAVQRGSITIYR
ncbi:MAG: HYR domain-containing protein [Saprospiraceae bacterium]